MLKSLCFAIVLLLSCVIFPRPVLAHSVQTDYQVVANALQVQSTFSTGEAFQGAIVRVFAPNQPDRPWLEGSTDTDGKFSFQPDQAIAGDWSVEIGEGDHGDILSVPVNAQGIDAEAISQAPEIPHVHAHPIAAISAPVAPTASRFTRQMLVVGMLLGGLGTRWWLKDRRHR